MGSGQYIVLFLLLALSALFSASETALTSLSKIRLRNMVEEGVKGADRLNDVLSNPKRLLTTILVGNNIVNIGASSLSTGIAIDLAGNNSYALAVATVLTTLVILIFSEITPKNLAAQNSEKIALSVCVFIDFCIKIFSPVVFLLNIITNFFIKILGGNPDSKSPLITEAELKTLVNVGQEEGVIESGEQKMITNVFDFGDTFVKNVMTQRTDISAIPLDMEFDKIAAIFQDEGYSRLPVFNETIDDIIGVLLLKDMFFKDKENFSVKDTMREVFYTYESKPVSILFNEMQKDRIPIAIVLDEYGGTAGLVTLEDLVEEIVGEIIDEYDDYEDEIQVIKEDEYIVDGTTKIDDINEMIGVKIETEDFETIGGYVVGLFGYFPNEGEAIERDGIKFVVESLDKKKIDKLRINT